MTGHRYSFHFIIYSTYFFIDIKYYYNLKKSALVEINGQISDISLKENLYFLGKKTKIPWQEAILWRRQSRSSINMSWLPAVPKDASAVSGSFRLVLPDLQNRYHLLC